MLIKVSTDPNSELYLNTDHIRSIAFRCKVCEIVTETHPHITYCYVDLIGHSPNKPLQITEDAGRLLLILVDANDSLIDRNALATDITSQATTPDAAIPQASLTTRIAQLLRDTWKTASLDQIMAALNTHNAHEVLNALDQLLAEKVVLIKDGDGDTLYYHASQRAAFQEPQLTDCPECAGTGKTKFTGKIEGQEQELETLCYFCGGTGKLQSVEAITPPPANVWEYGCENCAAFNTVPVDITSIEQANCKNCRAVPPPWLRDNLIVKLIMDAPGDVRLIALHAQGCEQCAAVIAGATQELCGTGKFIISDVDLSALAVKPQA